MCAVTSVSNDREFKNCVRKLRSYNRQRNKSKSKWPPLSFHRGFKMAPVSFLSFFLPPQRSILNIKGKHSSVYKVSLLHLKNYFKQTLCGLLFDQIWEQSAKFLFFSFLFKFKADTLKTTNSDTVEAVISWNRLNVLNILGTIWKWSENNN